MATDLVEFYKDAVGEWRWRRKDGGNHKIKANGGEGYVNLDDCQEQAEEINKGAVRFVVNRDED